MNLISCDSCAAVLDKDKLPFASNIWNMDETEIDPTKAEYNYRTCRYSAYCRCPVCKVERIFKDE